MKTKEIKANFDPITDRLHLRYDAKTRNLLQRATVPISVFLDGEIVQDHDGLQILDLELGFLVLSQLATETSPRLTSSKTDLAFELVWWSSYFLALDRPSARLFSRVVSILAEVTFMPLSSRGLPPAKKVFAGKAIPTDVFRSYQRLRLWKGPGLPMLSTQQMYGLWLVLKDVPPRSDAVETLVSDLDISTLVFRATIDHLARVDLGLPKGKKEAS
jgi:hypothetical protein